MSQDQGKSNAAAGQPEKHVRCVGSGNGWITSMITVALSTLAIADPTIVRGSSAISEHLVTVGPSIALHAAPMTALADAPFQLSVTGLAPHETAIVEAQQTDAHGTLWRSRTTVAADRRGVASIVAPTRLLEDMRAPYGITDAFTPPPFPTPMRVRVSASADRRTAHVTLIRRQLAPQIGWRDLAEPGLVGAIFGPTDGHRHRGIVVLGGSEGGYDKRLAALLASHGYSVLSLAYFAAPGLPKSLVRVPVEIVTRGIARLVSAPGTAAGGVYVIGTSRGGELAMLAGLVSPSVRGVVAIVPSPIVFAGLQFGTGPVDDSPWTVSGVPVPYITFARWQAFEATGNPELIERAYLPLDRLQSPLLLVTAEDDKLAMSYKLSILGFERLIRTNPHAKATLLHYAAAGHMLDAPYLPTTNLAEASTPYGKLEFGGAAHGYAAADRDFWPKLLSFIAR